MKKIRNILLSIALLLTVVTLPVQIKAANENIALKKATQASTTYPGKDWTAEKTVDGIIDNTTTKNSRWSSKRVGSIPSGGNTNEYDASTEQWLLIDLGGEFNVSQVNIFWEGAFAKKYKVQSSNDGITFHDILDGEAKSAGMIKHNGFVPVRTKYIRIDCLEPNTAKYGYSIFEVEVFQQKVVENADDVVTQIQDVPPTIASDGKSIILPEMEGYDITLFGTDNEQVIRKDGTIIKPLVDMDVNVMYKVVNKNKPEDSAESKNDVKITIPGSYQAQAEDNAKPNVLPGLREWKGSQGDFTLGEDAQIVYVNENQKDAAMMIQTYFKSMLNREINIITGTPKTGDIYLETAGSLNDLGKEGYNVSINDYITITAPTYEGLIYGGASITQILYQNDGWNRVPKGIIRDYPQYEVRAGMIDVGRMYIPMEYLEEMTVYMSWYKMNEAHIHINDYWDGSKYSAFRLESKVYPSINAKDGYYTQDEYRAYQKNMKKYNIDVITEIDTPYHSEVFRDIPGVKMLKAGSLDITTNEAFAANQKIIENLFDEYLDGDDPVIQSKNFHIGTDEYDKKYGEQMRKWTDHFIHYVNDKGYDSRAWASLGKNGFNGTTPVSKDVTMNLWAPYWSDVHETYDAGYNVINTYGGWLYIVPEGNAGYPDRFDTKKLYEKFEVNDFKSGRNPSGEAIMPVAHPQTKGASFAIWNDMTSFRTGFSWFDVMDRMKDAVSLVAEKTWFGEDEANQTYDQFRKRIDALQNKAANTNPNRFIETRGSKVIADYDISTAKDMINDVTDNKYHASLTNGTLKDGSIHFNGDGYIALPMQSIGYPYTVTMDVKLSEVTDQTALFSGKDGTLYADLNGKVGYKRGDYGYTFDYTLEKDKDVNLTLVCDQQNTTLYVNGKKIGSGKLTNTTIGGKTQKSSTFVLPVEKIFEHTKGTLSCLSLYNIAMSESEIHDMIQYVPRVNLALNKTATASALEVTDGRFTADKAVDGVVSAESRISFAKSNEQWLTVDLGKEEMIGGVSINYESAVGKYEIQISNDNVNFETVYTKDEATVIGKVSKIEDIAFTPVKARYVRYLQKEMWQNTNKNWYSGSIYEFNIFKSLKDELLESVTSVENEVAKYEFGDRNGQLNKTYYEYITKLIEDYKELANKPTLTQNEMESAKTRLAKELKEIPTHILYIKQEAVDALQALKSLNYHNYTVDSYTLMKNEITELETMLSSIQNYEDVNSVLQAIKEASKLLVDIDNTQLVALIDFVSKLDFNQYKDVKDLKTALEKAKEVYEKPISQDAIQSAYQSLLTAYRALQAKDPELKPIYTFIQGANTKWEKGSDQDITYRLDADFSTFIDILVNDKVIDQSYYMIDQDNATITLKATYLKSLTTGTYTITVAFKDQKATTTFTIYENGKIDPANPDSNLDAGTNTDQENGPSTSNDAANDDQVNTGDHSSVIWFSIIIGSSLIACIFIKKRRDYIH